MSAKPRNPGPNWGYRFLLWADRWWPRWLFRLVMSLGTWVALVRMPDRRRYSREYLSVVLGRPARWVEVHRHFSAFMDFLMVKLRTGSGAPVHCLLEPEHADGFRALADSGHPALFGTFHFGSSDLLGYLLSDCGQRVSILRLQVENSEDTRLLGERFGDKVAYLWVNDPRELLFALKGAIEAGRSVALKCDRVDHSARTGTFDFLGSRRLFPVTIYHLALLFDRPVVFCIAVPGRDPECLRVFATPVFRGDPELSRELNLAEARNHFQAVLAMLDSLVRSHPYLWFNYIPLNPVAKED
ncbi:MAG: hypothetical protein KBA71_03185 [Opitutaceae bacterium]|nr:hypothetical protein [Opitutaceae bacterium]